MATTEKIHTADGNAATTYSFTFPYFKEADVYVHVDDVEQTQTTKYTFPTATEIKFTTDNVPASGAKIRIFRNTEVDSPKAVFATGSAVRASDLNNDVDQLLYSAQENQNFQVRTEDIIDDAVTGTKLGPRSVDSEHIVIGAIDLEHMSDNSVDSDQYVDGSIDTEHIADDAVTLDKMAGLSRGNIIYGNASNNPTALAPGSADYVLTSDGTDVSWAEAVGEVTVQDEGVSLATAAATLNFTGAGVSATGTGATKTINITGGTNNPTILTLRNSANDGAAVLTNTEFTLVTSGTTTAKAVLTAQQLLISINGVIQQPNAGTDPSGLDGFVIDTGTTGRIKFCAAPGSGAEIFIVQLGDVVDIGTPADGTITEAKLNASNAPTDDYVLTADSTVTGGFKWAASSGGGGGGGGGDSIDEGNSSVEVVDTGSTGYARVITEGTEKLRVTSDGKLGIGTTTPDQLLHIYGGSAGTVTGTGELVLENSANTTLNILTASHATEDSTNYDNYNSAFIKFGDQADINSASIEFQANNNNDYDWLTINTHGKRAAYFDNDQQLILNSSDTSILNQALYIVGNWDPGNTSGSSNIEFKSKGPALHKDNTINIGTTEMTIGVSDVNNAYIDCTDRNLSIDASSITLNDDGTGNANHAWASFSDGSSNFDQGQIRFFAKIGGELDFDYDRVKFIAGTGYGNQMTLRGSNTPGHNLITNGSMNVWQRGVGPVTTSGIKTVDRWSVEWGGLEEAPTIERLALTGSAVGSSTEGPWDSGLRYALKVTNGDQTTGSSPYYAGSDDYLKITQIIEAQDIAKSGWYYPQSTASVYKNNYHLMLSFFCRSSFGSNMFMVSLRSFDGDQQRSYVTSFNAEYGSGDYWSHRTLEIPYDSDLEFDVNNGKGLELSFWLFAGSDFHNSTHTEDYWHDLSGDSDYSYFKTDEAFATGSHPHPYSTRYNHWMTENDAWFAITGVQLEVAHTQRSNFDLLSYNEELAKCQRYYSKMGDTNDGWNSEDDKLLFQGYASTAHAQTITYPVAMRKTPTITKQGTWTESNLASMDVNTYKGWKQSTVRLLPTNTGDVYAISGDGAYLEFDAEF